MALEYHFLEVFFIVMFRSVNAGLSKTASALQKIFGLGIASSPL